MRLPSFHTPAWPVAAVVAAAAAAALVPYLPATPDLYVHLLWSWQVARCLASGALPVWLPDLNAGFGSPGIRLYSPLGPVVEGAVALVTGSAGAALRVVPVLVWGAFLLVLRRRRRSVEWTILLLAPPVVYSLLGRGAWSEFLAVPLLWCLAETAVAGNVSPRRDGAILAGLWLLHAPTTEMAVLAMGGAAVLRKSPRMAWRLVLTGVVAAGLTAWHWLPLASEVALTDRAALTGGIFTASRNVLGSPTAHALDESIWFGWSAVALLAALVLTRSWRVEPVRTALAVLAVALASPLAVPLYAARSPLSLLQFPARWLLVAAVLSAGVLARASGTTRAVAGAGVLLLPLLVCPLRGVVPDPGLKAATSWPEAGRRVFASFGGNPLLVDASQNRPRSWNLLGSNLVRFGGREVLVEGGDAAAKITRWAPLDREVELDVGGATTVAFRVLDYPGWRPSLDGAAVARHGESGASAVRVLEGHHVVRLRWVGNPLSRVGQAVALASLLALLVGWVRFRRREPSPSVGPPTGGPPLR